jgi:hypothetical protein
MRKRIVLVASILILGAGVAWASNNRRAIREFLTGFQEAPVVVSTTGTGTFRAQISRDGEEIAYTLSFKDLEGDVRQSHIHIGPEDTNGPIVLWLCQTAANPAPAGTNPPQCADINIPASFRENTVSGVLTVTDIIPQAGNGIAAGEFGEVIRLIRAGKTYVNVHSAKFPPGEIRSQLDHDNDKH